MEERGCPEGTDRKRALYDTHTQNLLSLNTFITTLTPAYIKKMFCIITKP